MSILTPGSVANLKASDAFSEAVTLKVGGTASLDTGWHDGLEKDMETHPPALAHLAQVQQLQEGVNGKYKCQFSDGKENISGILTSQVRWISPSDVMVQSLLQRLRYFHAWPCRKTMHLRAVCPARATPVQPIALLSSSCLAGRKATWRTAEGG